MVNKTVLSKSALKSTIITLVMALGVTILSAVADFLVDTNLLTSIFGDPKLQMILIPVFAWLSQFIRDYVKHS